MSGRPPALVWKYFDKDVTNTKNPKVKCKGCETCMQGIPVRMDKHVRTCKGLREKGLYIVEEVITPGPVKRNKLK